MVRVRIEREAVSRRVEISYNWLAGGRQARMGMGRELGLWR